MLLQCPCSGIRDQGVLCWLQFELATLPSGPEKASQGHTRDPVEKLNHWIFSCQPMKSSLMQNKKILTRGMYPDSFRAI